MGVLRRVFSRFLLKGTKLVSKPNVLCIFVSDVGLHVLLSPRAQNAGYGTLGLLCVVCWRRQRRGANGKHGGALHLLRRLSLRFLAFSSFFLPRGLPTILFLDVAFLLRLVDQLVSTSPRMT